MDRQSSTVLIVDVDAAMDSNDLESFLYMIDTQRPWGSTGEGTSRLTSVTDGEFVHTMNWLTMPVSSAPRSVPKHTFAPGPDGDPPLMNIKGEKLSPTPLLGNPSARESRLPDDLPSSVGAILQGKDRVEQSLIHPPPEILSITGEAVARGVLFPALYGSPALEGGGLYWSATVDTRWEGTFSYDIKVKLTRLAGFDECGQKVWESCVLPCRSRIRVVRTRVENGFDRCGPRRRSRFGPRSRFRHRIQRCVPHFYTTGD